MIQFFPSEDEFYVCRLTDGRVISVIPLTFGRARVHISPPYCTLIYDDGW